MSGVGKHGLGQENTGMDKKRDLGTGLTYQDLPDTAVPGKVKPLGTEFTY